MSKYIEEKELLLSLIYINIVRARTHARTHTYTHTRVRAKVYITYCHI